MNCGETASEDSSRDEGRFLSLGPSRQKLFHPSRRRNDCEIGINNCLDMEIRDPVSQCLFLDFAMASSYGVLRTSIFYFVSYPE